MVVVYDGGMEPLPPWLTFAESAVRQEAWKEMMLSALGGRLVLEIEVEGYNVDGLQEAADEYCDGDVLSVLTDELMREDCGLTLVSLPGEKNLNSDFEVHAMNGRIVGARIVKTEESK
jgi:hypothetical protein